MKKVSLIVHKNYAEELIKKLYETGLMQIKDISEDEIEVLENVEKASINPDAEICANYELRLSRLIDILNKIKPKKGVIKTLFYPELPIVTSSEKYSLEEIYSYTEGLLSDIENHILEGERLLTDFQERKENINSDIEHLIYIKDFDIDLSDLGESEYIVMKAGKTYDLNDIKTQIRELDKSYMISHRFSTNKKVEWGVLVAAHISEKDKIEKIFREKILEFDYGISSGTPRNAIRILQNEKKSIEKEEKQIRSYLREYSKKQLNNLLYLFEEFQLERIRLEISKNFAKTSSTLIIQGWILEKNEEFLKDHLEDIAEDHILSKFEAPSINPDNPPVYIETPKWAEGFKSLLSMFALPKYNEINPTIIMGIFFVLFFGVMLGDAGYGLIILILSLFGYFRLRHSDIIRSWSFMGIWMGIVTTIFGFLTNSFFGDFIPRFFYGDANQPLYSLDIGGIHFPANAIKDPLTILGIALILGLIHLNIGVILGIYQSYKTKNYKEMITARSCWIPLQIGGGLLISNFILDTNLPQSLFFLAWLLVLIGIIQLFLKAGPIGFFNITGYVGDWLSYARLLALGLATAGMALAFNVISQLMGNMIPFIGIVVMVILLILAHTINLGLQALGAGIHSLRLQYVEFFNRFYEGGGQEFSPFKMKRKFTKKNEKKMEENT
jgi:V/A-type H+-transporting ATPase subunit I